MVNQLFETRLVFKVSLDLHTVRGISNGLTISFLLRDIRFFKLEN